jgi:hypothetical protein
MYWYMHALDALSTRSWDAGDGGEMCTRTLTMHALKVLTGWWGRQFAPCSRPL